MKPIKLVMSAIGPYSDTVTIEFGQFEEKGLFLIAGDTGAGKTTIFDAICFALFSETSGAYKDEKSLRSEYVDVGTKSYVDFYFSHQGKKYNIYRQPGYVREKQRGEGTVEEKEKVILYEEGEPPIEGVNPVKKKIQELLSVDVNQFKQLAMIAQGEFLDLLNAKTDKRTDILRSIFMTDGYKNMEFRLRDRKNAAYNKKDASEKSIIQYFSDIQPDNMTSAGMTSYENLLALQERVRASKSAWNLEEILEAIDAVILENQEAEQGKQKSYEREAKELQRLQAVLANAETNNQFIAEWNRLKQERQQLLEKAPQVEEAEGKLERQKCATRMVKPVYIRWKEKRSDYEITKSHIEITEKQEKLAVQSAGEAEEHVQLAEGKRELADNQKKLVEKIDGDREKYQNREALLDKQKDIEKKKGQMLEEDELLQSREKELLEKIQNLKHCIEQRKEKPVERTGLEGNKEKLEVLRRNVDSILKEYVDKRGVLAKACEKKQEVFLAARQAHDSVKAEKDRIERELENCRAGILATKLTAGSPCPVCGSTEHPVPAQLPAQAVSEAEFEKIKKLEKEAADRRNQTFTEAELAKTDLQNHENQMQKEIKECLANPLLDKETSGENLEELLELLRQAKDRLGRMLVENQALIEAAVRECRILQEAEKELKVAQEKELPELTSKKQKFNEEKEKLQAKETETITKIETLQELPYENWNIAVQERDSAKTKADAIYKEITDAQKLLEQRKREVTELTSKLQTLKGQLDMQKKQEEELLEELQKRISEYKFTSLEEMQVYVTDENVLKSIEDGIQKYRQQMATNAERLEAAEQKAAGRVLIDVEELSTKYHSQKEMVDKLQEFCSSLRYQIKTIQDIKHNIEIQQEGYEKAYKEYSMAEKLYKLVAGQTASGKITLEQYVQAAGFDGIIRAANRRLYPMSDGQYELFRQKNSLGRKSNTFLDLEVEDHYTGHRRPVSNLSGGESFKASLSLALGLSDTISSNLGGIQMDALFIDEGFGTLDKKSIENAMDILLNLSGSNKLVGIISHREELMENIPQKILVTKNRGGSSITIQTE